ncbi:MAG: hypothetical protein MZV63_32065 [Marinilabiliales bacterium]|nr:hypothetical protein [Marinilabiliales bacterium]
MKTVGVKPTTTIETFPMDWHRKFCIYCEDSGLGCRIFEDKIPLDAMTITAAEEFVKPVTAAMNGGEDYELLFTINMNDFEKVKELEGISIIGHMTEANAEVFLATNNGPLIQIEALGVESYEGRGVRG